MSECKSCFLRGLIQVVVAKQARVIEGMVSEQGSRLLRGGLDPGNSRQTGTGS